MSHVAVVGGGAIGLLTARELSLSGARVTVIDRQSLAKESSWAGGGIVSPLYPWRYPDSVSALAAYSQDAYPVLAEELELATGQDPEFEPSGMLIISPDEESEALAWAQHWNKRAEILDSNQSLAVEPAQGHAAESTLWFPDIGQIRNPRLLKALRADLQCRKVTLLENQAMESLKLSGSRVTGVTCATMDIDADAVAICAGAWTRTMMLNYCDPPFIRPIRGQMLLFKGTPGAVRRMVLEESRYVIPRRDGRVLFGSTLEESGFEKHTTQTAYDELYALATQRFPVLGAFPVERHWAGLRPSSPAGVPYICAHPQLENLVINSGHFRNGIVLGPASARLAADLILRRNPAFSPEPYSLNAPRG